MKTETLAKYRARLDEIDQAMAQLFEERMEISKQIGAYKKENSIPIEDKAREKSMLLHNIEYIKNVDFKEGYEIFLQTMITLSKEIQK